MVIGQLIGMSFRGGHDASIHWFFAASLFHIEGHGEGLNDMP